MSRCPSQDTSQRATILGVARRGPSVSRSESPRCGHRDAALPGTSALVPRLGSRISTSTNVGAATATSAAAALSRRCPTHIVPRESLTSRSASPRWADREAAPPGTSVEVPGSRMIITENISTSPATSAAAAHSRRCPSQDGSRRAAINVVALESLASHSDSPRCRRRDAAPPGPSVAPPRPGGRISISENFRAPTAASTAAAHSRSGSPVENAAASSNHSPSRVDRSGSPVPRCGSPADPYKLRRFTQAQKTMHAQALSEVRAGRKLTGWMWYVIPTPPYIVKGVERGSADNRRYALRTDDEVHAYLEFKADGADLKNNYLEIMVAVRDQLRAGRHPTSLMGKLSAPKLTSSVQLFERVSRGGADKELQIVLGDVMDLLETFGDR